MKMKVTYACTRIGQGETCLMIKIMIHSTHTQHYTRVNLRRHTVGGYVRIQEEKRSGPRYILYYNSLFPHCQFAHTHQRYAFLSWRKYILMRLRVEEMKLVTRLYFPIFLCFIISRCSRARCLQKEFSSCRRETQALPIEWPVWRICAPNANFFACFLWWCHNFTNLRYKVKLMYLQNNNPGKRVSCINHKC